jgi:hypothetical protein
MGKRDAPPDGAPRPLPDPTVLGGVGIEEGAEDGASGLPGRLERYGKARRRAKAVLHHLRDLDNGQTGPSPATQARRAAARLERCGEWLLFRHYWTVDKVRLHGAEFCKQHMLCQLCAVRRAAKQLGAYLERLEALRPEIGDHPRLALMTYTVKNGPDLLERMAHLRKGLRTLSERRRAIRKGNRGSSEWGAIAGAVGTLEVTNRGRGWHPHAHMIVVLDRWLDQAALSAEWRSITGDSFVVGISRLDPSRPIAEGFAEVFKYALKFSDLTPSQIWTAASELAGQRLLFSLGCFRGVEVPEELTDEPLDDLPYVEWLYRYLDGAGYTM